MRFRGDARWLTPLADWLGRAYTGVSPTQKAHFPRPSRACPRRTSVYKLDPDRFGLCCKTELHTYSSGPQSSSVAKNEQPVAGLGARLVEGAGPEAFSSAPKRLTWCEELGRLWTDSEVLASADKTERGGDGQSREDWLEGRGRGQPGGWSKLDTLSKGALDGAVVRGVHETVRGRAGRRGLAIGAGDLEARPRC